MSRHVPRREFLIPSLLMLGALLILVSLGTWQMERKAWKEALIAAIEARLSAPPAALPPVSAWTKLNAATDEFRRVHARVKFIHDKEAFVYTAGSSFRTDVTGPGYWVFTPAQVADGGIVMINRGFVPLGRQDLASRSIGQASGEIEIIGALRWPETKGFFAPKDVPERNLFFGRDPAAVAAAKGISAVAPFYIEQEAPLAPEGWPRVSPLRPSIPNNHFGYALTWYGLALALLGVFSTWVATRLKTSPEVPKASECAR